MRVLHLTRDFPPRHCGGITTAVAGLVRALASSGVESAVASFDDYRPAGRGEPEPNTRPAVREESPVPLLRIDTEDDLAGLPAFAQAFAPDLIQLHVDLLWEPARELRDRLRVPLVATLHVCHRQMLRILDADRESASLGAQERALEQADLLAVPTRAAAEAMLADYPEIEPRLRVAGFTVEPGAPASLAEPRLLVLGRFGAVKGTDRLIALLPHLLADPRVSVDVVGGLPRNPRRDRRWRQQLVEAAGAAVERIRFHGWLDPEARDGVLSEARALLSLSRIETFGLAALEALARGVPVCGYRESALVETAAQQVWLDDDSPADVAASILALLTDRDRCLELGRSGREAVRPWSVVAEAWCDVHAEALGRPHS